MLGPIVPLLLIGSNVGVHVAHSAGVSESDAASVAETLARAVEERTGRRAVLDEEALSCTREDRCLVEIAERTGAREIVLLEIYAGPTKIRFIIERIAPPGTTPSARTELNLLRAARPWSDELGRAAATLFPEGRGMPAELDLSLERNPPELRSELRLVPWFALGAATVASGIAIGLGVSARNARSDAAGEILMDAELERLVARSDRLETGTGVCLGIAAAGLITAAVVFLIE